MNAITVLEKVVPWVISLLSVCAAIASIWSNKRIAEKQAIFSQKAQIYGDFLQAFSALAYDCNDAKKRDALTNALYRACMYAQKALQFELNCFVNLAFSANNREEFVITEKYLQDVLDGFGADLQGRNVNENSPLHILAEELAREKASRAGSGG